MIVPKWQWAATVKSLDDSKCQFCGSTASIEAHHIKQKSTNPELACEINNGISLCRPCHLKAHGGFYNPAAVPLSDHSNEVTQFIDSVIPVALPAGQKAVVDALAAEMGISTNKLINELLRVKTGQTEEQWKKPEQ